MIYLKAACGGLVALVVAWVGFCVWVWRQIPSVPPGAEIGFSPSVFVMPVMLLWEVGAFAVGFGVVWVVVRRR